MSAELEAAVALLAAHADRDAVVNLLKTKAGAIHHAIHQDGFNGGYGKNAGELKAATDRATEADAKAAKAAADLEEARKGNPDAAKVQEQINALELKHKTEKDELMGRVKGKEKQRAAAALESALIALGVEKVAARVYARDHEDRLVPGDDGETQVLQPGLTIPYAASGEKPPVMLLAEAIKTKVPASLIVSNADAGAGSQGADAAGPAGIVARIQKEAAERKTAEAAAGGSRLGPDGLPKSIAGMAIRSV